MKGGNATRRIRIGTGFSGASEQLRDLLLEPTPPAGRHSDEPLPIDDLDKATAQHVWSAVQTLLAGERTHSIGAPTQFDLIADDGRRLPPEAVFSVALSRALGREVSPRQFTTGDGSPCFHLLKGAGYDIVPKDTPIPARAEPPSDMSEVDEWDEGARRLVSHMKAERWRGLSKAKKAEFREKHGGRLFCERCAKDPVVEYATEHAEACIEVHHARMLVSDMADGHKTKLNDLQCLCANCHRLVHRLLRSGVPG